MALSATAVQPGGTWRGQAGDKGLKLAVIDVTIGATTDYTVGTGFPGMRTLLAKTAKFVTMVALVRADLRASGGAAKNPLVWATGDANVMRLFEARAAGAPMAEDEIEQADLTNGDVVRCVILGY